MEIFHFFYLFRIDLVYRRKFDYSGVLRDTYLEENIIPLQCIFDTDTFVLVIIRLCSVDEAQFL